MACRARESCASFRPVTATCTFSATSARAIARPIPLEPPVTIATFPCNDSILAPDHRTRSRKRLPYNNPRMERLAIIGAGELGGAIAHAIARRNLVRSITIIDASGDIAAGKALDIAESAPVERFSTQLSGEEDLSAAIGADAVVIADRGGLVTGTAEWRGDEGWLL